MAVMKDSTKRVFKYLQGLGANDNVTANDVASALNLDSRTVNGVFTAAIQRKNFGFREEKEIELADGTHTKVKFLRLNADGRAFDLNAADAE